MTTLQTPHRTEQSFKEVQVVFGGKYIAKTNTPLLVWEQPSKPPQYYLPEHSLLHDHAQIKPISGTNTDEVVATGGEEPSVQKYELTVDDKTTVFTAFRGGTAAGYVRLEFAEMGKPSRFHYLR